MRRFLLFALAGVLAMVSSGLHAQNLLANPGFDQSLAGWTGANYDPQRNPADANGSTHSGSLRAMVPGGSPQGGGVVYQCVPVTGGAAYDFSVKAKLQQAAGIQFAIVWHYASNDCSGPLLDPASLYNYTGRNNVWLTAHFLVNPPAGAHSAQVELYATTQIHGSAHTVFYDDVYFGPAAPATCVADDQTLCIDHEQGDARFRVRANWSTMQSGGLSGVANAISLSPLGIDRGGIFWFFGADNPEALVKILDGCGSTGYFWVFISAGTNVGVNLFVGDTETGAVALFHNPDLGPFPAIQNRFGIPCPLP
jgi:hypothetical protein